MAPSTTFGGIVLHLICLSVDQSGHLSLSIHWIITILAILLIVVIFVVHRYASVGLFRFTVDNVQFNLGGNQVTVKPCNDDMQVAYKLWTEISTRKIGLPIDFEHDVIDEIYDSWHEYFKIARELVGNIPVTQVRKLDSTRKIIALSMEILNNHLRPHLTKWQASYRAWLNYTLKQGDAEYMTPQTIQKKYPKYDELKADMEATNKLLIEHRDKLREIVLSGISGASM